MSSKPTLAQAMKMGAKRKPPPKSHPPLGRLLLYREGRLSDNDEAQVREHLSECLPCTHSVLELSSDPEEENGAAPSILSAQSEWVRHRAQRAESPLQPHKSSERRRWLIPVAAAIVLTVLSVGTWMVFFTPGQPEANPRVIELVSNLQKRGGEAARPFALDQETILVFSPVNTSTESFGEYYATIQEASGSGTVLLEVRHLRLQEGFFAIQLPADFLSPGEYVLRLYGKGEIRSVNLGDFDMEIVPPAAVSAPGS